VAGCIISIRAAKVAGMCDDCSIALTQRADDREPWCANGLRFTDARETAGDYYEQQGKLTVVDAALSPDERFAKTVAALN